MTTEARLRQIEALLGISPGVGASSPALSAKAPLASPTFTGSPVGPKFTVSGLTGATAASRYVGATASGVPASGTFAVGDFVIDQTGVVWVCVTAGSPGTWGNVGLNHLSLLTTGEETCSRLLAQSSAGISASTLRLTCFTARKNATTTQVRVATGGTAAAATPTLCRIGLYALSGTTWSLVASTANDTTLFATQNTGYTKSWQVSYAYTAGQRLAVGLLVVSGATTPNFAAALVPSTEAGTSPRVSGTLGTQSDLPNSTTDGALSGWGGFAYAALL